jgi:hypothetical protein
VRLSNAVALEGWHFEGGDLDWNCLWLYRC